MATCPECDAEIEIDDDDIEELEIGDPFECDECGSELRVASLDPLEFDPDDLDEEEDEDDEEDDDEEDEDGDEDIDDLEEDEDGGDDEGWDE
jgi:lysine biosynthesis protein LysW